MHVELSYIENFVFFSETVPFKEKCSFSFASYHPYGVACIVFDWKNNLLIAAGNYGKEPFQADEGMMLFLFSFKF